MARPVGLSDTCSTKCGDSCSGLYKNATQSRPTVYKYAALSRLVVDHMSITASIFRPDSSSHLPRHISVLQLNRLFSLVCVQFIHISVDAARCLTVSHWWMVCVRYSSSVISPWSSDELSSIWCPGRLSATRSRISGNCAVFCSNNEMFADA